MKKMLLLFSFLFLLLFTYSYKPIFNNLLYKNNLSFGEIKYSLYCLNVSKDLQNCEILNMGNGYIVKTSANNAKYAKTKVSNILGESISFKSSVAKIDNVIDMYNIKIIKVEKFDKISCLYGYSEKILSTNCLEVDKMVVNIQIAFNNDVLTIGCPIILDEF